MMEFFIRKKMRSMSTEEKIKMFEQMMPIMLEEMDEKEMFEIMSRVMPSLMDKMMGKIKHEHIIEIMKKTMPEMMLRCFSKLDDDKRKKAIEVARDVINNMEKYAEDSEK